jgi:hypothetical protein
MLGYFWRTICPGWPQTMILPISISQVARLIGVRHWHPAIIPFPIQRAEREFNYTSRIIV